MTRRYVIRRPLLEENIRTVKEAARDAELYAVLKADGYGLGLEPMARTLISRGIYRFALTEPEDVLTLCGLSLPVREVLLMRPVEDRETAERLLTAGLVTFAVGSAEDAAVLASAGESLGVRPRAHVKVDTGLGRYGVPWDKPMALRYLYESFPAVDFTGIYTHFACACRERETRRQFERFLAALRALTDAGVDPGLRHCCGSSALFRYPDMRLDAVRVGSALLGRVPGGERFGLCRVGWCEAQVETVRALPAGAKLGYGGLYRARRDMRVAVVNVGATHGLGITPGHGRESTAAWLRELARLAARPFRHPNAMSAEISGARVALLGSEYAECAMLDVTDVPCRPGDSVRLDINPLYQRNMERVWTDAAC